MYPILDNLHSWNRYILVALLAFALVRGFSGWFGKKPFTATDNKASLFLLISTHIQLLLGLILYFVSPLTELARSNFGEAMKNGEARYYGVEHVFAMVIAVVFITLARVLSKKASSDEGKFKKLAIYTTLALVIIVVTLAPKGLLFGSNG